MDYSGSSTLVANIYASADRWVANISASADRWEDVTKVKVKMKAIGVKKASGCSSIEVDGCVHEFLVGDASHRKMKEVHAMLDGITRPLSGLEDIEMEADNKVAGYFGKPECQSRVKATVIIIVILSGSCRGIVIVSVIIITISFHAY
ncbi:pentatricopeptide repeat-containing protein At1g31430-like [Rhododendron vialii]|uniref:pentatricopeptide repeat-containing protein At1g31430-like n=1 Tax=Rhododendron vialii TaxID=182163 RepID=UPI00265DC6E3|nr:pentatricopeptide repeat-containing protein At1g31430-like [Rhododendron vialii]